MNEDIDLDEVDEEEVTQEVVLPVELLPGIPSIDDEEPGVVEYLDWSSENTKVVSGPIGPVKQFPGRRFRSRAEARAYWVQRAGRIIAEHRVLGRYVFRVRRDA